MMKSRLTVFFALVIPGIAGTSVFADQVVVPQGCTAMATVHKEMCHTTTLMDCGARREALTYSAGEPLVRHIYTPNWEMTGFGFADGQIMQMTTVPESGTNMELAKAIQDGSVAESGDFLMNTNVIKDRKYAMTGRIEMPGDEVELNGVPFHKGRIFRTFELKPGAGGLEFEVDVYVAKDRDLIFEASWQRSIFGNNLEVFNQSPMAIYFPGEDGFLATRPETGCE